MKFQLFWLLILIISCQQKNKNGHIASHALHVAGPTGTVADSPAVRNSIHVFTALCDNKYQGIVPVPAKMGNGQDTDNNLYWGWGYGVCTCFNNHFKADGDYPLLWTSNLFGPEAYSLHDALSGYIRGENAEAIQRRAATVYARFTKCSVPAAKRLLVTGW